VNSYQFADITIGLEVAFEVQITEEIVDSFMRITRDISPLHLDEEYAKGLGLDGRVVYGMLTSSFYSTLVGVYLPGEFAMLHGIDIQFSKPVYIGEKLKVVGKVSYMNAAYKQIELKAHIINESLKKISKATIKIGVTK